MDRVTPRALTLLIALLAVLTLDGCDARDRAPSRGQSYSPPAAQQPPPPAPADLRLVVTPARSAGRYSLFITAGAADPLGIDVISCAGTTQPMPVDCVTEGKYEGSIIFTRTDVLVTFTMTATYVSDTARGRDLIECAIWRGRSQVAYQKLKGSCTVSYRTPG